MVYDRNDRRWGEERGSRGDWRGGDTRGRPSGYDYDDRGFFERAGDEVRSWFGDEEAERRRRYDERYDDRYQERGGRDDARSGYGRGDYDRGAYARSQGYGRDAGGGYAGGSRERVYGEWDGTPGYAYGGRGDQGGAGRSRDQGGGDRGRVSGYEWRGGGGYGSDRGEDRDRHATHAGGTASDHSYRSWRDRQMQDLDRDYDDYRRENQSRFESEFSTFRTRRQGQRDQLGKVKEHMDVVGSDGQHVGTVDHVQGDRIKLTKTDEAAGGKHHLIPSSWIDTVDEKVTLSKTGDEAKKAWSAVADEERRNDDDRQGGSWQGDRNLNRSFSGTY